MKKSFIYTGAIFLVGILFFTTFSCTPKKLDKQAFLALPLWETEKAAIDTITVESTLTLQERFAKASEGFVILKKEADKLEVEDDVLPLLEQQKRVIQAYLNACSAYAKDPFEAATLLEKAVEEFDAFIVAAALE